MLLVTMQAMDSDRIAGLLVPFLGAEVLTQRQLQQISAYLDLLIKWNSRMNLTAVRDPEQMVARHFGESVFAAVRLFPQRDETSTLIDVGSGAGFPGLPIAILRPGVRATLVEAQGKKATFLREVVRALELETVTVHAGRAEALQQTAAVVTMRAVEKFEQALTTATRLAAPGGRIAALIGEGQVERARGLLQGFVEGTAVAIPGSSSRVLHVSVRAAAPRQSKRPERVGD